MAGPERTSEIDPPSAVRCVECGARLAHDQRYCLACGARRGPLRGWIAQQVARIREQGRAVAPARRPALGSRPRPVVGGLRTPDPRLAAVGVMAVLSFGVVVGSIATPTVANLASAPLVVVERAAGVSGGSGSGSGFAGGGGAGGGGVSVTRTITVTSSGSAAPSAAAPVAAASPSAPSTGAVSTPTGNSGLPPIKHVFLVVLTDHSFNQTFSPVSTDAYLNKTLPKQGKLIESYYAVAESPLANEIALISGQGPNPQTIAGCPEFTAIAAPRKGPMGQVLGSGCVYPTGTQTVADQLASKRLTWKAYVQDMGKPLRGKAPTCRHPALGSPDPNQTPVAHDPYVTSSNPFVYFSAQIGKRGQCAKDDVSLDALARDLKSAASTPALSYIVPSACDNGSERPCAPSAPAGLPAADSFLKKLVAEIKNSPAYKNDGGLIMITFDQAPQSGPGADSSSCCTNPTYPNLPVSAAPTSTTTTSSAASTGSVTTTTTSTASTTSPPPYTPPPAGGAQTSSTGGGGQVGLLLISPYVKPGTTDVIDYFNHFSLLASIEKLFALGRLGYAKDPQLPLFDPSIFDRQP